MIRNLKLDWDSPLISRLIDSWIEEDVGSGDLTASIITKENGKAEWISKEEGIFCGREVIKRIFHKIDSEIEIKFLKNDGTLFSKNDRILELNGSPKSLLAGERITLNIAMHLSGISTYTNKLVKKLKGTKIHLADTRKTTPGLRKLEKYAFKCGGGINHRMGLYDAAMIKENHIAWSEDLIDCVKNIRENTPFTTHIIIEAENMIQARDAILAGADSILLDEIEPEILNKNIQLLRDLINKNRKRCILEISGIKPDQIENYLIEGVDLISTSSSVTKSNWIDLSMRYIN